jgi:hypothetical protein
MTRVLHGISRWACPAADRPWIDALFAELYAIESRRARLLWLLGAGSLLIDRFAARIAGALLPRVMRAALLALAATAAFAALWLTGYEGLSLDDDFYMAFTAVFIACLFGLSVVHLRRQLWDVRP